MYNKNIKFTLIIKLFFLILLVLFIFPLHLSLYQAAGNSENLCEFARLLKTDNYKKAHAVFNYIIEKNNQETKPATNLNKPLKNKFNELSQLVLDNNSKKHSIMRYNEFILFEHEITDHIESEFTKVLNEYIDENLEHKTANRYFDTMETLGFSCAKRYQSIIELYRNSRNNYKAAIDNMNKRRYLHAISLFKKIIQKDTFYYNMADKKINECTSEYVNSICVKSDELFKGKKFEKAGQLLDSALQRFPGNQKIISKIGQCNKLQEQAKQMAMVEYDGIVEHIFFHPLIAYPELAFDNDFKSKSMNDWFVTVKEFNRILNSLYEKDFILVDINSIIEKKYENGKIVIKKRKLMVPKGKKPIIISIDDLNYYNYMINNGTVHKLVLNENGDISTLTEKDNREYITDNNGIIPLIDKFVKEHPDFSLNGAKGVIALTGYQGILGYRTHEPDSDQYISEKKLALPVIKRLKETGWTFACHGYGHLDAHKISFESLKRDTKRWKREVENLIGSTCVYIYPHGSYVPYESMKFEFLLDSGFQIFCAVGPTSFTQYRNNALLMDRRHIDGISLRTQQSYLIDLFDANKVIDTSRAGIKKE